MPRKGQTKKLGVSQGPLQIYKGQPLILITFAIPSTRLRTEMKCSGVSIPY